MDVVRQTIETYNKIAPDYCKRTRQPKLLKWEEDYIIKLLSFIRKPIPLILDVGCADGRHCLIAEMNGAKAIGIDLSENMLEEARAYYPNGDFRLMDMRKLLFADDCFDGIWSSGSIYHVQKSEVAGVIDEFRRVLRPGGVLAVNFKVGNGEGMEDRPKSYDAAPRYFAYYTHQDMKETFEGFGFRELDSCTFPEAIYCDEIRQMWFRLTDT